MYHLQTPGFDLPELDPSVPLLTTPQAMQRVAEKTNAAEFTRYVLTSGPDETLQARLLRVAREHQILAEMCGVTIVPHEFGLYPDMDDPDQPTRWLPRPDIVPSGFLLAARVAVVRPSVPITRRITRTYEPGRKQYNEDAHWAPHKLSDVHRYQFRFGKARELPATPNIDTEITPEGWHYIDIEPRTHITVRQTTRRRFAQWLKGNNPAPQQPLAYDRHI